MKTDQLLDRAMKARGYPSDYRLAKELNVTASTVAHWRAGRSTPNDAQALKLAGMIEGDAASVFADIHAERARSPAIKAIWRQISKTMRAATAAQ